MQIVNIIRTFVLLVITTIPIACNYTVLAGRLPATRKAENTMPLTAGISVKSVTLTAREENSPPLGIPPNSNRDIGFASVLLRLENTVEESASLVIQKIEIRNASDSRTQQFSQTPQEIRLHPLENSENAFHLTNKIGYLGQDKVKAVITYKIGSQRSARQFDGSRYNGGDLRNALPPQVGKPLTGSPFGFAVPYGGKTPVASSRETRPRRWLPSFRAVSPVAYGGRPSFSAGLTAHATGSGASSGCCFEQAQLHVIESEPVEVKRR